MRAWLVILAVMMSGPLATAQAPASETASTQAADETESGPSNWVVCNETSFIMRVATALERPQGQSVRVKGWDRVRPSECMTQEVSPDMARYLFAESDPVHNGGVREWAGQFPICVNPDEDFRVDTSVSCALQGLETRRFLRINPSEPVTKLIEPDDFGTKAITAGLQRLMQDAGYNITRVDGINGRRTRNTLKEFIKEAGVDKDMPVLLQIDALAQTARSKQQLTGLTVCNETPAKSWISIGYREDGSWQSRGWWLIEPAACVRPWTKDIAGAELHLYAQQDGPEDDTLILKNPVESVNNFCVAEGKFSALGREFCIDQGYVAANFRALPTEDEKGLKISLMQSDFTGTPSSGLRQ